MHAWSARLLLPALLLICSLDASSDPLRVATASNFAPAMNALARQFEAESNYRLITSFGSTGKHYAQIVNGAPFDLFFAADSRRPELLETSGAALPGSRFTYAIGKLVLWSPEAGYVDSEGAVLRAAEFRHLALANPTLAPYGAAAAEVLEAMGLGQLLGPRLVRGENIGQAFQFIRSGNAELGFVAWSQLVATNQTRQGSHWDVPQSLYTPIEQQAVILKGSEGALAFVSFVRSPQGLKIIHEQGYDTPDVE